MSSGFGFCSEIRSYRTFVAARQCRLVRRKALHAAEHPLHQRDKRRHAWYYRSCAVGLRDELGETDAWRELSALVERVFSGVESLAPDEAALPRGDERAV